MPPIESWKAQVGFSPGPSALYKSWRDAAKLQMMHLGITGKADAGQAKWVCLVKWTLKKRPFGSQAHYHSTPDYAKAVDGLLMDVANKRAHILRQRVDLDRTLSPASPPRPGMHT